MEDLFEGLFENVFRTKTGFIIGLIIVISLCVFINYKIKNDYKTHKHVIEYNKNKYYTDSNIVKVDDSTIKFYNGDKWIITNEYKIVK